ncbi:MAG: bifunctional UDP-N-acetylmuramoyl-tripeptide:D-alanyl-D-alanine ligase/alanine racemase [Bacteroides sp.]|nr:bifunctional UDP-N-acetylmuramoyl-tripeptide:D-alanyl-D-alanine ligase/alanine racemase [Bacteroides sp.]
MKATIDQIYDTFLKKGLNLNLSESIISNRTVLIDTLLTDSRSLTRPDSSLFFAIETPGGNDGHKYISELYERGVRNFVASHIPEHIHIKECTDINFFIVDNAIQALQATSSICRNFSGEVVAITGSRGKTTLKEWIFQLMEPLCEIARSPRSYNSQIGVPLSMWEIEDSTSIAIIEAGISKSGEMATLRECINPDTVIFTNIGDAHSDGFTTPEGKAMEKALLIGENTKTIIFNQESDIITNAVRPYLTTRTALSWSLSNPDAPLYIEMPHFNKRGLTEIKYRHNGEQHSLYAPIATPADLENAAGALAFMLHKGINWEIIADRFSRLHKISTRLNVADGVNDCSVILDSYTSDFSSLRPAIDFMMRRKTPGQTPVIIMSDILHETSRGTEIYQAIADVINESGIHKFIGIGRDMTAHSHLFGKDAKFFLTTEEFLSHLSPSDFISEIILLKGSPDYDFNAIGEMLEARKHETVLEVNLDSIVSNYNYFRSHVPASTGIICMVKASGYGAGSYEIAKTLQDCGAAYLAVAVLDEGIDLRKSGIRMPIMVMNPKVANYRSMFANNLEPEIYSLDMLEDVIREARKNNVTNYPIHLKLDTGMHRTGLLPHELGKATEMIIAQNAVKLSSMFSHLATADCIDMDDYTLLQLSRFKDMTEYVLARCPYPVKRHVLNSAGILRFPQHHYDMVRLGIGLYGANTLPPEIEKPLAIVSTLRTVIIAIREWEAGETIGYSRKGILTKKSKIATIPIGYADGMNRHFGRGNISVIVNGKLAPTVGNICMDACMIDVTGIDCKVGDAVEIFGEQAPLQRLADTLDTIPYEILTSVSPRVKRIYYRE